MIGLHSFEIRQSALSSHSVLCAKASKHVVDSACRGGNVGGRGWSRLVEVHKVVRENHFAKTFVFGQGGVSVEHEKDCMLLILKLANENGQITKELLPRIWSHVALVFEEGVFSMKGTA